MSAPKVIIHRLHRQPEPRRPWSMQTLAALAGCAAVLTAIASL